MKEEDHSLISKKPSKKRCGNPVIHSKSFMIVRKDLSSLERVSKHAESSMDLDKLEMKFTRPIRVRPLSFDMPKIKIKINSEQDVEPYLIIKGNLEETKSREEDEKIIKSVDLSSKLFLSTKISSIDISSTGFQVVSLPVNKSSSLSLDETKAQKEEKKELISTKYYSEEINLKYNSQEPLVVRSSDQLRKLYYSKLIHKKYWNPSRNFKKNNTLIIFDWDDTLLPTTFLTPGGEYNDQIALSKAEADQFKLLEKAVYKILTLSLEKGDTYIITNAAPGWVEYTASKFYPSIMKVLQKLKIMSARGGYEKLYPKDYRQWKIQTFLEMKKEFNSSLVTNIICIGDSMIEMEAGHLLSSKFNKAYIKTIKFRESPKLKVVYKQLLMITDKFEEIYLALKSLAISIDKKSSNAK